MNMDRRSFIKKATEATLGVAGAVAFNNKVFSMPEKIDGRESKDSSEIARKLLEKQYEQLKKLKKEEENILSLFGDFYTNYKSESYSLKLKALEQKIIGQIDHGEVVEVQDIVNQQSGFPENKETPKTTVEAINTKDGVLSKEVLQQILQETFPKGWINNEIESIKQNDFDQPILYRGVNANYLAGISNRQAPARATIEFYKCAKDQTGKQIVSTLCHEIGHANDWEADNEMTALDRATLILKTYKRMKASEHFESSYVESISEDDFQKNNYSKVTEYWAVICECYFTKPDKLSEEDFLLVDKFVKKTDPKFNIRKARGGREKLTPRSVSQSGDILDKKEYSLATRESNVPFIFDHVREDGNLAIIVETIS